MGAMSRLSAPRRRKGLSRSEKRLLKTLKRLSDEAEYMEYLLMLHELQRATALVERPLSAEFQAEASRIDCETKRRVVRLKARQDALFAALDENDSR